MCDGAVKVRCQVSHKIEHRRHAHEQSERHGRREGAPRRRRAESQQGRAHDRGTGDMTARRFTFAIWRKDAIRHVTGETEREFWRRKPPDRFKRWADRIVMHTPRLI
eukprot:6536018-Prymnesium_polylepis.1